jgi:hypothetical protein
LKCARRRNVKGRALVRFAFGPGPAAVPGDNAAPLGQPDTRFLEFLHAAQALERAKKLARLIYNEPNACVALILLIRRTSV